MREQRPEWLTPAVDATAENLPFDDLSFDAALASFTVHQWADLAAGLQEVRRVTRGPVVIGSGRSLSVLDVVGAVRKATGAEFAVRHGPAKPGEMPAVIVDPGQAHAKGWRPRLSFEDGLRAVWEEWSRADPETIAAGAPAAPVIAGGHA